MQLDQATLEDLLMPNISYSMETLYNFECVLRMVQHFMAIDQATSNRWCVSLFYRG
ncbi:putative NPH3 domain-containing protein [Helianthus anomalus]